MYLPSDYFLLILLLSDCFMGTTMEEIRPFWGCGSESTEDLKQKLLDATLELESANKCKMELFHLLNIVYRERDELREALTEILQKLATTSSLNVPNDNVIPETRTTSPNTSITESNNLSDGTSAVDSFLDAVSSPDFSNMNIVDSQNVGFINSKKTAQCYPASVVIENMIKGKALPQKGKLLQTVMEAGPLLQTLLVAGPLPCWTNPPPIQDIKLPPFNLKDFKSPALRSNPSELSMKAHGTSSSSSMLNFAINNPVSWQSNLAPRFSYQAPTSKRQRL